MENVHLSNPKLNLYIVVPRNKSFFKEMIISYNYLNVVEANKSNLGVPLVKFLFDSNYVVVPPTAGSIPLRVKILARIISLMPRSFLVGFKDLSKFNFFYDKFFKFDTTIFYLDVMKNLLQEIGFSLKKNVPSLRYLPNLDCLEKFGVKDKKYLVFHPFGSVRKRSINNKDIIWVLENILDLDENTEILLTAGNSDKDYTREIENYFLKDSRVKIVSGLNPNCLLNLINNSICFIGVDTGVTHLASFINKKSLVIANNGTLNWLPYYNKNATILYKLRESEDGIYSGLDHIVKNNRGENKCFEIVPKEIIFDYIKKEL